MEDEEYYRRGDVVVTRKMVSTGSGSHSMDQIVGATLASARGCGPSLVVIGVTAATFFLSDRGAALARALVAFLACTWFFEATKVVYVRTATRNFEVFRSLNGAQAKDLYEAVSKAVADRTKA